MNEERFWKEFDTRARDIDPDVAAELRWEIQQHILAEIEARQEMGTEAGVARQCAIARFGPVRTIFDRLPENRARRRFANRMVWGGAGAMLLLLVPGPFLNQFGDIAIWIAGLLVLSVVGMPLWGAFRARYFPFWSLLAAGVGITLYSQGAYLARESFFRIYKVVTDNASNLQASADARSAIQASHVIEAEGRLMPDLAQLEVFSTRRYAGDIRYVPADWSAPAAWAMARNDWEPRMARAAEIMDYQAPIPGWAPEWDDRAVAEWETSIMVAAGTTGLMALSAALGFALADTARRRRIRDRRVR